MAFAAKSMNRVGASARDDDRLSRLDWLMVVILTIPVFGTFFPIGTYMAGSITNLSGQPPVVSRDTTVVLALILLTIAVLYAKALPHSLQALRRNWPLLLFVAWAAFTARWAEIPSFSFNRSGRLIIAALYGIYLVELMNPKKAVRVLFYAFSIALFCSLAVIVLVPSLAATTDGRGFLKTWRGATSHKNTLGTLAGMGFLFAFTVWRSRQMPRWASVGLMTLGLLLMLLANSVTALVASFFVFGVLAYFFYGMPVVKDRLMMIVIGLLGGVTLGLVVMSLGSVFALFGRDSTLTGRSEVWAFAHLMIEQKPFWGYGHGAWGMPIFQAKALSVLLWPCAHAHNFWIDLRLQLGVPGLGLGILIWGMISLNILRSLLTRSIENTAFPLGIFVFLSIRSYSETIVLDPDTGAMFWLALCFASFSRLNLKAYSPAHRAAMDRKSLQLKPHRRFGATS